MNNLKKRERGRKKTAKHIRTIPFSRKILTESKKEIIWVMSIKERTDWFSFPAVGPVEMLRPET